MMKLYQFAISHFCEKARWALDYKLADYELINLMPGLHILKTKTMAPATHVPLLQVSPRSGQKKSDALIVQGSGEIITYLDDSINESPLTPVAPAEKEAALEWEAYLDNMLGIHVRRFCYYHFLQHKDLVLPLMTYGTPWYNKSLMKAGFAGVAKLMRKSMNITPATAEKSKTKILTALEKINKELSQSEFLVGDRFSRADLTAASLIAPILQPAEYGAPRPAAIPRGLVEFKELIAPQCGWALDCYRGYRGRPDLV